MRGERKIYIERKRETEGKAERGGGKVRKKKSAESRYDVLRF